MISGEYDPQAWNGYAYVRNNPLRFTDPTGKRRNDVEDAAKEQHDLAWALRALAAARDAATMAQEWASAVPEPAPPCYDCALAIDENGVTATSVQPNASGGDGGGDGIFGMVRHVAGNVVGSGVEGAKSAIKGCAASRTCTRAVGGGLVLAGGLACPVAAPACAGAIVLGTSILVSDDVRGCGNGSGASCAQAPLDVVLGAVGVAGVYGVASVGAVSVAGAVRGNAAWRAAVDTSGGGAAVQVLPDLAYQFLKNRGAAIAQYGWDLTSTGWSELR